MTVAETTVWSKSQVASFQECARKHAISTWNPAENSEVNEQWNNVRRLKKLSSRHLWPGSTVHTEIGEILKTVRQGQSPQPLEDVLDRVKTAMRDQYKASLNNLSGEFRFFEHEYKVLLSREVWGEPWTKVETCLRRFYGSAWFGRLKEIGPEGWKAVDEVVSFTVDEIKAYVKIDCAIENDGLVTIFDWKTSALREGDAASLQTAALYAHEVWGAEPEAIQAFAVSLIDGKTQKVLVDEEVLMETHLRIQEEAAALGSVALTDNPFDQPATPRLATCERCNFKQLCFPSGVSRAPLAF